jgi:hypothetical protein
MIALGINIAWLLIGLIVLVGIGYVVLWVLGQLGIILPPMVVKFALIILGLLVLIFGLGLLAGGGGGSSFPAFNSGMRHSLEQQYIPNPTEFS